MSELQITTVREIARLDRRYSGTETTEYPLYLLRAQAALLGLPALRAAWSMAPVDYQRPECGDIGPWGYHLQSANALGDVEFSYDTANPFAPIAIFSGAVNSYLSRVDGGAGNWADILGTEPQILAVQRGLTSGGWFWWSALPGVGQYLIAKHVPGVIAQYTLNVTAANLLQWTVWPGGVGIVSGATINVGWNHCAGIYDQPSQDLHVILNGVVATNAGAAPAALADTAAPFTIGADGAGGNRFTGYASMCSLQACSMYDSGNFRGVLGFRQQTRSGFGV